MGMTKSCCLSPEASALDFSVPYRPAVCCVDTKIPLGPGLHLCHHKVPRAFSGAVTLLYECLLVPFTLSVPRIGQFMY